MPFDTHSSTHSDNPKTLKISSEYILREIAGEHVIIPVGQAAEHFSGLISVNQVALSIWKVLQEGSDFDGLVRRICAEYEVSEETARQDICSFLEVLRSRGLLEES